MPIHAVDMCGAAANELWLPFQGPHQRGSEQPDVHVSMLQPLIHVAEAMWIFIEAPPYFLLFLWSFCLGCS